MQCSQLSLFFIFSPSGGAKKRREEGRVPDTKELAKYQKPAETCRRHQDFCYVAMRAKCRSVFRANVPLELIT